MNKKKRYKVSSVIINRGNKEVRKQLNRQLLLKSKLLLKSRAELIKPILLFLLVYIIGILFYTTFENMTFIDAFYFVTATALTVGYGDITPKTEFGKFFTALFSWFAVSTGFYLLFKIGEMRAKLIDSKIS
ncbi:MAG: potassium channel family protein [Candidatus Anstonellales archaeon]